MKIYSMTATFGKLEHETLTLKPGLNVIYAPNEWGKSTWCAFLLAMLYGLDTRAKTTKNALADKERFAPWSGSPMSGRIDLNWKGRDITIERSTKGRIPLGAFRAYETDTGLEVPELTAENCGYKLLGAEQSVFRRAGFIRFSDLPVTQDDALRARLNALVTTGDESGDGARLEKQLRDLKNKIRYNRTGLLPQAEAKREELEAKLGELEALTVKSENLSAQLQENQRIYAALDNHLKALAYAEAQAHAKAVEDAWMERQNAWQRLEALEEQIDTLPTLEEAEQRVTALEDLRTRREEMDEAVHALPPQPVKPDYPAFEGMTGAEAVEMARNDAKAFQAAAGIGWVFLLILGFIGAVAAAFVWKKLSMPIGAGVLAVSALCLFFGFYKSMGRRPVLRELTERYGNTDYRSWTEKAQAYSKSSRKFEKADNDYRIAKTALDIQLASLRKDLAALCGEQTIDQCLTEWKKVLKLREAHAAALRDANNEEKQYAALKAMAKHAEPPQQPDELNLSEEETREKMAESAELHRRMQSKLSQYRGKMEALGDEAKMRRRLTTVKAQARRLEETYAAASLALKALEEASNQLQRRFAPKITGRSQQLLAQLTDGRYDRLTLSEDFTLWTGTGQEDVLHDALWRSDGTVDQLYLALRLAVAESLTPKAPLILDDALVRFDEPRLKKAMEILRTVAQNKQVILFTCQRRETML